MTQRPISDKSKLSSPFDPTVHKTERTANQKMVEWMNRIIREAPLDLGLAEQETTAADGKQPDIVIFERPGSQKALCVIELKRPYFDPFDEKELKEPAREKATARKARYFATSNFKRLIWYNTERANNLRPEEEQIHATYVLSEIENLDFIEDARYRNSIVAGLERFLADLSEVHTGRKAEPRLAIDEFLVIRLHEKIERLSGYYRRIIDDRYHKDPVFAEQLLTWFAEQNWMFIGGESDFLKAARQTAYLLVNKILFYNVLQAKRPQKLSPLSIPKDLEQGGILRDVLQAYFDYVLKHIDYQTIYRADFIDQTAFPEHTGVVEEITELVRVLRRYDFSKLRFDVIGRIFERIIPQERRHQLGQHFTHPDVVDLILCFCLRHEEDKVFDPSCGAGTFLVRAYHHKRLMNQRLGHTEILKTLWGCDIGKFPAHLSTINLAINDLGVDANYPQILHQDFFALRLGGREEFSAEARTNELMSLGEKRIVIPYPKIVDCIVGNPPYTRQEEISEIAGDEGYKGGLIQSALYDGEQRIAEISKRAGIHAYFFVHGTKFLQDGGRFGFIVSNSWLDVDYGKGLQELFLKYYKIVAIIESKLERWFEEADINTCIVILERCTDERERDEHSVRFVYLLKPLRHFIPPAQDMWEEQLDRLNEIGKLMKTILAHSEFYQNEELRIFPKRQADLWEEGFDEEKGKYVGAKWGKYIRAPQIFFRILEKGKEPFVALGEIAKVRRGFTTGANAFFYLTEEEIKRRRIEREYLQPIIFSLKEVSGYKLDKDKLAKNVIICHKTKEELKGTRLLRYIQDGERKGFHERPTCASRGPELWYCLGKNWAYAPFIFPAKVGERMPVFLNDNVFEDKKLYGVIPKKPKDTLLLAALLNSTVSRLFVEFTCRQLTGAQAIADIDVVVVENLSIPDPSKLSSKIRTVLERSFDRLSETPCESIFSELAISPEEVSLDKVKPERRELDRIVMGEILGLSDEEQLDVYRAVVDLVKSRIEKAKSFGKRRKTKEGIDVDLLVKTLRDSIGEETLGKFYKERILNRETLYTKTLPKVRGRIRIEQDLYGWRLYHSGKRYIECASESEARYLKVWLETGLEEIKVPEDESYLESIIPDLERLKKNIVETINEYLNASIPIKLRNRIQHQLWGIFADE